MQYDAEQISEFHQGFDSCIARAHNLSSALVVRSYREDRSRVLAAQGVVRRIRTLIRCIEQVYELIPPDAERPSRQCIEDTAVWLQAFFINTYGAIDNFARLWVFESGLKHKGKDLLPMQIGLTPNSAIVRESLSLDMQAYMSSTDAWFKYLENYRHALAHRIPLYIPLKHIDEGDLVEWRRLEMMSVEALEGNDFDLYDKIIFKQSGLGEFRPLMMHAFGPEKEAGNPVLFHGQMICDLATVIEIGEKVMGEINSLS